MLFRNTSKAFNMEKKCNQIFDLTRLFSGMGVRRKA
jgi:hypothetical protein